MLNSVLERRRVVSEIFGHFDSIQKVYTEESFDFSCKVVNFYILLRYSIDSPRLLDYLQDVYSSNVRVYLAYNVEDIMFEGKKVIWKDGKLQGDLLP